MKYRVALQESEEGFSVRVPGLPGCVSQGTTEEEALANIADAVREYFRRWANSPSRPEVSNLPHPGDEGLAGTALQNRDCHLVDMPGIREPREQA